MIGYGASFGESRPLFLFKNVGGNLKNWGEGTFETFVNAPLKEKDYVGAAIGSFAAAISVVTELPDAAIAGVADQEVKYGEGSRTGRDLKAFGSDLSGGHFLKAGLDVLRMPGNVVMDGLQLLTRGKIGQALAA